MMKRFKGLLYAILFTALTVALFVFAGCKDETAIYQVTVQKPIVGGTVTVDCTEVPEGGEVTVTAQSNNGYSVSYVKANEEALVLDGNTAKVSDVTSDIEITAAFTAISYPITWVTNGGALTGDAPASYTVEDEISPLPQATKEGGYVFDGWYTNENFTPFSKIESIATGTTGELKLYAKFTQEYLVSGTLSAKAGYTLDAQKISASVNGKAVAIDADGNWSVGLPNGVYEIVFTSEQFMPVALPVTVDGENVENLSAQFTVIALNGVFQYEDSLLDLFGNDEWTYGGDSDSYTATKLNGKINNIGATSSYSFIGGLEAEQFVVHAKFTLASLTGAAGDALFGFTLASSADYNNMYSFFRRGTNLRFVGYDSWNSRINVNNVGITAIKANESAEITLVRNGNNYYFMTEENIFTISFVENSGAYHIYYNGVKTNSQGNAMTEFPLYLDGPCAIALTFSDCLGYVKDLFYSTDEAIVDSYITRNVTVHAGENGTVTKSKATVYYGEGVTLTFAPEDGYRVASFRIGEEGEELKGAIIDGGYTITNITTDLDIYVTFEEIPSQKYAVSGGLDWGRYPEVSDRNAKITVRGSLGVEEYPLTGNSFNLQLIPDVYTIEATVGHYWASNTVTVSDGDVGDIDLIMTVRVNGTATFEDGTRTGSSEWQYNDDGSISNVTLDGKPNNVASSSSYTFIDGLYSSKFAITMEYTTLGSGNAEAGIMLWTGADFADNYTFMTFTNTIRTFSYSLWDSRINDSSIGLTTGLNATGAQRTITLVRDGNKFLYIVDGIATLIEIKEGTNGYDVSYNGVTKKSGNPQYVKGDSYVAILTGVANASVWFDYTIDEDAVDSYLQRILTLTVGDNGDVTADKVRIGYGESVTLTFAPDEGYRVASFTIGEDGEELKSAIANGGYTIANVRTDLAIFVTFELIPAEKFAVSGSLIWGKYTEIVDENAKLVATNSLGSEEYPLSGNTYSIQLIPDEYVLEVYIGHYWSSITVTVTDSALTDQNFAITVKVNGTATFENGTRTGSSEWQYNVDGSISNVTLDGKPNNVASSSSYTFIDGLYSSKFAITMEYTTLGSGNAEAGIMLWTGADFADNYTFMTFTNTIRTFSYSIWNSRINDSSIGLTTGLNAAGAKRTITLVRDGNKFLYIVDGIQTLIEIREVEGGYEVYYNNVKKQNSGRMLDPQYVKGDCRVAILTGVANANVWFDYSVDEATVDAYFQE